MCHALHSSVKSSFARSIHDLVAGLAATLAAALPALASLACGAPPLILSPLPPAAAACPIDGCAAVASTKAATSPGDPEDCPAASVGGAVCTGGTAEDCARRAMAQWERSGAPLSCIARMFSEACAAGELHACGFAGRLWLDGRGVAHDTESVQKGLGMLTRACDGGLAASCAVAARWLARRASAANTDTPDNADEGQVLKARLELEQACLSGQADACFQVGQAFEGGNEGFPRDVSLAATEYARGCDLEDARACNSIGCALEYGDGVPRDSAHATEAFERSCHLGESTGCANVGYMAEHGEGTLKDLSRARGLYRDACRAGEFYGCVHADMLAAVQAGAPADFAPALAHWERLCAVARSARACEFASILYLDGVDGGQRDPAKSLSTMARACSLGESRACLWVKSYSEE